MRCRGTPECSHVPLVYNFCQSKCYNSNYQLLVQQLPTLPPPLATSTINSATIATTTTTITSNIDTTATTTTNTTRTFGIFIIFIVLLLLLL